MRTVLFHLPVGVWFQDKAGRIVYGNPAAKRIWGGARYVGPESFHEYKGWWAATGKRIEAHEWAAARAVRDGRTSLDEEIEIERFDGARRSILNSAFPVRSRGSIIGAVIVNQDVTDRRAEQEAVREKASLIDMASDAVIVRGLDARILFWSRGAERTYGWQAEEALGQVIHELLHTRFPMSMARTFAEAVARGEWEGELRQRRKDGSEIIVTSRAALARTPDGRPRAFLMINRDITARKRMEEDLRSANARIRQTADDVNRLAYSLAHDLRAPVRVVNGLAHQILEDSGAPEGARLLARRILAAARGMSELLESHIDLSHVMRPAQTAGSIDLIPILRGIVQERRRMEPGRRVDVKLPDRAFARVDPAVARIVLARLFDNAWKFSSGRPDSAIEFDSVPGSHPPVFFMRDNGVGFPAADAERIFTPLCRLHPEFPGHGLGTAIIRRGVEGQGGRVWAEGAPGEGATFYLELPAAEGGA